jgi:hypothetical protein
MGDGGLLFDLSLSITWGIHPFFICVKLYSYCIACPNLLPFQRKARDELLTALPTSHSLPEGGSRASHFPLIKISQFRILITKVLYKNLLKCRFFGKYIES